MEDTLTCDGRHSNVRWNTHPADAARRRRRCGGVVGLHTRGVVPPFVPRAVRYWAVRQRY
eukprot:3934283-Rhodomonas_salina.1